MVKRWLIAVVLGIFVLGDLSITAASFGIAGTTGLFLGSKRNLSAERAVVTGLNATAIRDGVKVGDVYDFRILTLPVRTLLFTDSGRIGSSVSVPVLRGSRIVQLHVAFTARGGGDPAQRNLHLTWLILVFLAAFVGLFIIARGKGNASLAAGIMLLSFSLATSRQFSWAIAPVWLILALMMAATFAYVVFAVAAFAMAQYCLPPATSRKVRVWLWALFTAIMAFAVSDEWIEWPVLLFTGHSLFGFNLIWQVPFIAAFALTLVTLGIAATTARGTGAAAIRVLFVSSLIGLGAESVFEIANIVTGNLGFEVPIWAVYALLAAWVFLFAGYLYAIFAGRLYDVDFFISRTVIYGTVIAIVVGTMALIESFIERAAIGHAGNLALSLAATVLLGLSVRWIGQRVESIVEHTFYRNKLLSHQRLRALADDFAEAHNADGLAPRVAREMHKQFGARTVIYRFEESGYAPCAADGTDLDKLAVIAQDDPVFMRLRRSRRHVDTRDLDTALPFDGLAFPLIVLGRVYGAILAGQRPHDQWYDPDDQDVIAAVAHELGAALLWLRNDGLPDRSAALAADL